MSREVDERIVRLEFDNKDFEKNAKKSSSTIQGLKSSMDFSKEQKTFNKTFDEKRLNIFAAGLIKVKNSFSALEVSAITAIANISNRVTNLGINLVKSLSIDNIAAGWSQYGESMISKATLVAQGHDLEVVNKQLDKLRWFTDETSYDYDTMSATIGKFVASGKGLEESVDSMMGIATWAASAGENASTASRAMIQLAQAMGTYVKRQDWQSIQTANMDLKEFRENALETAQEMGTLIKLHDGSYVTKNGKTQVNSQNFVDSLTEGAWFTSDVLIKVLQKYAKGANQVYDISKETGKLASEIIEDGSYVLDEFGIKTFKLAQQARTLNDAIESVRKTAKSRWAEISELLFGDLEKSTKLWTQLSEVLIDLFTAKYDDWIDILKTWKSLGGFDDLFGNVEGYQGALWNLFDALNAIRGIIKGAWEDVFGSKENEERASTLKKLTERLRDFTKSLILDGERAETARSIFRGLFSIFKVLAEAVKVLWQIVKLAWPYIKKILDVFVDFLALIGDKLSKVNKRLKAGDESLSPIAKFFEGLKKLFEGIVQMFKAIAPQAMKLLEFVGDVLGRFGDRLKILFSGESGLFKVKDLLTISLLIFGIALLWWQFGGRLRSWSRLIKDLVASVGDAFDAFASKMYTSALKDIASSIVMVVAAIMLIASMDKTKLIIGITVVGLIWYFLVQTLDMIKEMGRRKEERLYAPKMAAFFIAMAASLLAISLAIAMLGKLGNDAIKGFLIVESLLITLLYAAKTLSSQNATLLKGAAGFIALAVAVNLLFVPIYIFSAMLKDMGGDYKVLAVAVGIIAAVTFGLVALAGKVGQMTPQLLKGSSGFIALSFSLLVLMAPLLILSEYIRQTNDFGALALSMATLAGVILGLIYLSNVMENVKEYNYKKLASALSLIGQALLFLVIPLIVFSAAMHFLGDVGAVLFSIAVLGAVVLGIVAIAKFAEKIPFSAFAKIAGALALVGLALIPLSIGMIIFASACALISKLEFSELVIGILAMAGAIAVFAAVSMVLAGGIALFAVFGLTLLTIAGAVGILTISIAALVPLLVGLGAGLTVVAAGFTALFVGLLTGLLAGIPLFAKIVYEGVVAIVNALINALLFVQVKVINAIFTMIYNVLDAIDKNIYNIVSKLYSIATNLLRAINDNLPTLLPEISRLLTILLDELLYTLNKMVPDIVKRLGEILISLIYALADLLRTIGLPLRQAILTLLDSILQVILDFFGIRNEGDPNIELFSKIGKSAGVSFVDGLVEAIREKIPVLAKILQLSGDIVDANAQAIDVLDVKGDNYNVFDSLWKLVDDIFGSEVSVITQDNKKKASNTSVNTTSSTGGINTDDIKYYPYRFNPLNIEKRDPNGTMITQNVNVYGVTDPEEVANVVSRRLAVESERYRVTTGS